MTDHFVQTVSGLEAAVGSRPAAGHLKSIPVLDQHCRTFLGHSPYAIVGLVGDTVRTVGSAGVTVLAEQRLSVRLVEADVPDVAIGVPVGLLAFAPGYGETLRINGRLESRDGPAVIVAVEEAFLHCAKCMLRSRLWEDPERPGTEPADGGSALGDPAVREFLDRSPFVALTSCDAGGYADVSPKGDPPGFLVVVDGRTLAIPDRPGNRRTDTFHNLLERPGIGVLALLPGDDRVLEITGTARITADPDLRAGMAVRGNVPQVAVVVDVAWVELRVDPALAAAGLWDTERHVPPGTLPRASKIWVDHVRLNKDAGLAAATARRLIAERPFAAGISRDYAKNLY